MNTIRIGFGYDVHRLVSSRNLILGGVKIPHPYGLLGHSDADVITHALCDAILGAAALGDLGRHFPEPGTAFSGSRSALCWDFKHKAPERGNSKNSLFRMEIGECRYHPCCPIS